MYTSLIQVSSKSNFVLIVIFVYLFFSLGDDSGQAPKSCLQPRDQANKKTNVWPIENIWVIVKQRLDENLNSPKLEEIVYFLIYLRHVYF